MDKIVRSIAKLRSSFFPLIFLLERITVCNIFFILEFVREDGTPVSGLPGPTPPGPPAPTHFVKPEDDLDTRYYPSEGNCELSKTVVQGQTSICKDTLIFNEEFDKTNLRELGKWDAETKFIGEPVSVFIEAL